MATDRDLLFRLNRLQRAMRDTRSPDLTTLRTHVVSNAEGVLVSQDFRSGATDEDLSNWLHQVIGLVTHRKDQKPLASTVRITTVRQMVSTESANHYANGNTNENRDQSA
jgi:hypothetical protein